MKKTLIFILIAICLTAAGREDKQFRGELGLRIPEAGIAVDAVYDPRLDGLVPGYRLINVAIVNNSAAKIFFDPKKDRWKIDDARGRARSATVSLESEHKGLWNNLPPTLKQQLEYPLALDPEEKAVFSLFFKETVDLREFRSISFYSSYLKKILTYYSQGIAWKTEDSGS